MFTKIGERKVQKISDDITLLYVYRSVAGQPWHEGDLCRKGCRGIGEERDGRRNEEVDKNEVGARRNERDMRKSEEEMRRNEEEMRRGNGVEMRRREDEDGRGGRKSSNVSHRHHQESSPSSHHQHPSKS